MAVYYPYFLFPSLARSTFPSFASFSGEPNQTRGPILPSIKIPPFPFPFLNQRTVNVSWVSPFYISLSTIFSIKQFYYLNQVGCFFGFMYVQPMIKMPN